MYRKVVLICVFGIGAVAMVAAQAFGSHSNYGAGGTYLTKGVRCLYEVTGTGSTPTTGICEIETEDALLQCINQGGNKPSETVALQVVVTGEESAPGGPGSRRGRSSYNVVNMFGTEQTDAECDASPACNDLRQFCNSAQWVPTDLVPLSFCGTFSAFYCTSAAACPCDPAGVTAPLCADHDPKTLGIDPLGPPDMVYCELPNPETFQFGEARPYHCVAATPQLCPTLFP